MRRGETQSDVAYGLNNIGLNVSYPSYWDWLAECFSVETGPTETGWAVEGRIDLVDKLPIPPHSAKLGGTIIRHGRTVLYWFNSDLLVEFSEVTRSSISLAVHVRRRRGWKRSLRRWLTGPSGAERNLAVQAFRHAVLYPYFVLLHRRQGVSFSHGCAFAVEGRGYAVLGFDAVGKSTIAALARARGAELLTDNFVIHDRTHLYFVPDPLRRIDDSRRDYYGKRLERIPFKREKVPIARFVFTYLGQEYSFRKSGQFSVDELNRMFVRYLPEYHDFGRYAAVVNLADPDMVVNLHGGEVHAELCECERASLDDNKRLLDDLLSV